MIVPGMQVGVRMRVAEQDASEEHRDRSEGGDASCDVRLLEDGRDQFDDMEHAMRNQGPFKLSSGTDVGGPCHAASTASDVMTGPSASCGPNHRTVRLTKEIPERIESADQQGGFQAVRFVHGTSAAHLHAPNHVPQTSMASAHQTIVAYKRGSGPRTTNPMTTTISTAADVSVPRKARARPRATG